MPKGKAKTKEPPVFIPIEELEHSYCPISFVLTVEKQIAMLRRGLNPKDEMYAPQHAQNLETIIRMYETGETTLYCKLYVMRGELISAVEAET